MGALKKGMPEVRVDRAEGMKILLKEDGSWRSLLRSAQSMDTSLQITGPPKKLSAGHDCILH